MQKATVVTIVIILLLGAILYFWHPILSLFAKDIPPINDSDLRLSVVSVPDGDNAYFDLIKTETAATDAEALKYFEDATRKPKFHDPAYVDPLNISPKTELHLFSPWRAAARLSAQHAMDLASAGKDADAMEEAFGLVRLGQNIEESQSNMLEYLVGDAMKKIGLQTIQKLIPSTTLSPSVRADYARELDRYKRNQDALNNLVKANYYFELSSLDKQTTQEPSNILYFQPNRTRQLIADNLRAQMVFLAMPCESGVKFDAKSVLSDSSIMNYLFPQNRDGKAMYTLMATDYSTLADHECAADALLTQVQSALFHWSGVFRRI